MDSREFASIDFDRSSLNIIISFFFGLKIHLSARDSNEYSEIELFEFAILIIGHSVAHTLWNSHEMWYYYF